MSFHDTRRMFRRRDSSQFLSLSKNFISGLTGFGLAVMLFPGRVFIGSRTRCPFRPAKKIAGPAP